MKTILISDHNGDYVIYKTDNDNNGMYQSDFDYCVEQTDEIWEKNHNCDYAKILNSQLASMGYFKIANSCDIFKLNSELHCDGY